MEIVFEVIGWVGTVFILIGYLLLSVGRITNGRMYQLFNLVGAVGLLINGAVHGAWPSVILNVVWSAIAVFALVQLLRKPPVNTPRTPSADSTII